MIKTAIHGRGLFLLALVMLVKKLESFIGEYVSRRSQGPRAGVTCQAPNLNRVTARGISSGRKVTTKLQSKEISCMRKTLFLLAAVLFVFPTVASPTY